MTRSRSKRRVRKPDGGLGEYQRERIQLEIDADLLRCYTERAEHLGMSRQKLICAALLLTEFTMRREFPAADQPPFIAQQVDWAGGGRKHMDGSPRPSQAERDEAAREHQANLAAPFLRPMR